MPSPAVELAGITVTFNKGTPNEVRALRGINLRIELGEYVSIIGPNGAGKSTLVNVLAGAASCEAGSIKLNNRDVTRLPAYRRAAWIGRVFQDPKDGTASTFTLRENLALAALRGRQRSPFRLAVHRDHLDAAKQMLDEYGSEIASRFNDDVGLLSGGQRQLLALIMAVLQRPFLLLLDEHVANLDPQMADQVMRRTDALVRENHLTSVMITHNMRMAARYGDRLLIMNRGQVVEDIRGTEKADLTEDGLVERFRRAAASELTDRLLGPR
jgi:putative tryptophan/tyrosine transport system ATP-binding protein